MHVVTLTATQSAGVFRVEGGDNQCGADAVAPVIGTAVLNPNGSVSMGLVIVSAPSATPLHVDATMSGRARSGSR